MIGEGASPTTWSTHLSISFLRASNFVCDMVAKVRGAQATVMNSSPVDAHLHASMNTSTYMYICVVKQHLSYGHYKMYTIVEDEFLDILTS